jgi:hypothetical protein
MQIHTILFWRLFSIIWAGVLVLVYFALATGDDNREGRRKQIANKNIESAQENQGGIDYVI